MAHTTNVLHAIVKEFLEFSGFDSTLQIYEKELEKKTIAINASFLPDSNGYETDTKAKFMDKFISGNSKEFWASWDNSILKSQLKNKVIEKLEFSLHLYFAVYPMIMNKHLLSPVEESMNEFKQYLEINGVSLSQTTDFVSYYALPYVPNPRTHPTFKLMFEESWKEELQKELENYLQRTFNSDPVPYLFKLYSHTEKHHETDKESQAGLTSQVSSLEHLVKQHEQRADNYYHKFAKVQGDYHNLIGISAELVDSLENCVKGQMITPEYLQNICERLFQQANNNGTQTIETIRPDTTASFLRASIANDKSAIEQSRIFPTLSFHHIQKDLLSLLPPRRKALLLQALIWRLTKTEPGANRDSIISSYLNNDIFGCTSNDIPEYISDIFSREDLVTEYMARFINTVASFTYGRFYMSQSEHFIKFLVCIMKKCKTDSLASENIVGGLQKLSLRRNVQTVLIESAVVEWLLKVLDEPDNLSDYGIEYTAALLMNLCLRVSGKKKCCLHPEKVLKCLSDLLGYDNEEIRPYLNGTLYSILSVPSIRTAACHMSLDEVLKHYLTDKNHDERQIKFIIKQMKTEDDNTDDDILSDDDDDDDDDEEGDAVETESEKVESIKASMGEKCGEELLATKYYMRETTPSLSVSTSISSKKSKLNKSLVLDDEPYTRPVTPARKPTKVQSDTGPQRQIQPIMSQERPRTSSSKGSRKPLSEQNEEAKKQPTSVKNGGKSFKQAFASRPKIPRTPESGDSRPSSSVDAPAPTRSISPPQIRKGSARNSNRTTPR